MLVLYKKRLETLVRDVLLGKEARDLTIMIKSPEPISNPLRPAVPAAFERRKSEGGANLNAVVSFPANRLLKPSSRSTRDYWTIIHKDNVVAEGQFYEIERVLSELPRNILLRSSAISRQVMFLTGVCVIMGLCFLVGFTAGRIRELREGKAGGGQDFIAGKYQQSLDRVNSSLNELLTYQNAMNSLIFSGFAGIMEKVDTPRVEPSSPAKVPQVVVKRPVNDFQARLEKQLAELEYAQLVELEQKKASLIFRDRELESQGCLPLHKERQAIATSLVAIDKQMDRLKKKLEARDTKAATDVSFQ